MVNDIIGAAVSAAAGVSVAFLNYIFSKKVLTKAPDKFSFISVVRTVIQVVFLALVYFVGTKTGIADTVYLLVGAVLGMTVPMFFFTKKLLGVNEAVNRKTQEKEDENG